MSADEPAGAEAAPAADREGGEEMDFVRAAIWFMGFLLAGFVVVLLVLVNKRDQHRDAVAFGEKNLKKMAATYESVKGLLKEYENSHADEVRKNTQTWLGDRYKNAGIQPAQVVVDPWKATPAKDYIEHFVAVKVKGITRLQAVSFLWSVERMSTKMRTIEMSLSRTLQSNQPPETDAWELKASFGHRVPRGMKEGGP